MSVIKNGVKRYLINGLVLDILINRVYLISNIGIIVTPGLQFLIASNSSIFFFSLA